jgi:soluble lytic murein transglycosylase
MLALGFPGAVQARTGTLEQGREDFIRAEALLKSGKLKTFHQLLDGLTDYPLYPYLQYAALQRKPTDENGILVFIQAFPSSRYAQILRKRYLKRLAKMGRWVGFLEHYDADSEVELRCSYYRALYLTGKIVDALEGARILWLSGKSRPAECDELFLQLRRSELFSSNLAWDRFVLALENRQVGLARYLQRFFSPQDQMAGRTALTVYQKPTRVAGRSGISPRTPRAGWIFAHGIQRMASQNLSRAVSAWDRLNKRYDITRQYRHRTEQRLAILSAMRRAPNAYSRFSVLDPALLSQDARFWKLRSALMKENWSQADRSLGQLRTDEKSMLKWRYWRARALAAQHGPQAAISQYREIARERDYYGFLAADRIGVDYSFNDAPVRIDPAELADLEQGESFAVVREWLALGRQREARRSWWQMVAGMNASQKTVAAKIAQKRGLHDLAIFTVAKADSWDDLNLRFPILFRETVEKSARQHALPFAMVYGIIRQESVFKASAVSPAGAIGLMQIMPRTGRLLARQAGDQWRSIKSLYDPKKNVRYGTLYLKNLLERFGGNMTLAVAGYNAGPRMVSKWLPNHNKIAADLWIDTIPFRETRRYVRYVLGYTMVYQNRLEAPVKRISDYMQVVLPTYPPVIR